MAEHRTTRGIGLRVGLTVVLVASLARGTYYVWNSTRSDCDEVETVSVIADTDTADYVTALADETAAHTCYSFTVTALPASHVTERLNSPGPKHIWVAESPARVRQVRAALGRSWSDIGPSLGVTPVVVAGKQPAAPSTWSDVMKNPDLRVSPPGTNDVSNAAVVGTLSEVSTGSLTHQRLIQTLTARALKMNDQTGPADLASIAQAGNPTSTLTTERAYAAFVKKRADSGVSAVVPKSGTVQLDYRLANVAQSSDQGLANDAIKSLAETLQTDEGRAIRESQFMRAPNGSPLPGGAGVPDAEIVEEPSRELVDNMVRKWSSLTKPIRALVVQDVSGSMSRDAGGRSRAALLREASLFGLQRFPKNTQLGYWEFSIDRGGKGVDYREVMPIAPISDEVDGRPNRELLAGAIKETLGNVHGGTGLYDTALAAFKSVYDSYDPAYSNSVIIMTDGKNEDGKSITLDHLVSELNIMKNPARRIPIITVGISEDADEAALQKISEATGGSSFVARDPKDIGTILMQAVSFRAEGA